MAKGSWRRVLAAGIAGLGLGYGLARTADRSALPASIPASEAGARVREVLARGDRLARLAELGALLRGLGPEAQPAVVEAFGSAPLDRGDPELVMLGVWWAGFDPEAAHRWTATDWRGADADVLAGIFRTWAARDPERAWKAAEGLGFRAHRELCMDSVIAGWDESGRPGLADFMGRLASGPKQQAAEALARRRVVALGPQRALEWVQSLPPDAFRALMAPRIASAASLVDPTVAAAWARPQIESGASTTGLPRRIATRWILRDPVAAMAWLASLPDGPDRDDGVTEAFRDWHNRDPIRARAWIESTEMQRWNEPAFGHFARAALAYRDPVAALEIVGRLTDDRLRNYLTAVIARGWLERDRPAADAWLRKANLPDDMRERAYMVSRHRPKPWRGDPEADLPPPDTDPPSDPR